jgi:hypothetical protein
MTDEDKQAAEAYVKLHEDVKAVVLVTVIDELHKNPWGPLAAAVRGLVITEMNQQMQNYRIVQRGNTASY